MPWRPVSFNQTTISGFFCYQNDPNKNFLQGFADLIIVDN